MDADPGASVRRMKDSSLVRAAEAVRDGRASAMVSAGNTGATMASALLRMGRIKGVLDRPSPRRSPIPGSTRRNVLLDAGANAECSAEMARAVRRDGRHLRRERFGIETPGSVCSPSARSPPRATPLVKEAFELLGEGVAATLGATFVGNVEGRDLMATPPTSWSPTASPATWRSRPLEGGCGHRQRPARRVRRVRRGPRGRPSCWRRPSCRSTRPSTPTPPAVPCCWASTVCASSATGRRRRPRRNAVPSPRRHGRANDVVGHLRAALAPADPLFARFTSSRSGPRTRYTPPLLSFVTPPPGGVVPAETHVEQGPRSTARRSSTLDP
jgi:hypothetical protein